MRELIKSILREEIIVVENKNKLTTQDFIERAKKVHGDEYEYELVDYKNNSTPVNIICKKHGVFPQSYVHHVTRKQGCPTCYGSPKKTTQEFIDQAKLVHPNKKYDYSLVDYKNNKTDVEIICNVDNHGVFPQPPIRHLSGEGCPKCAGKNKNTDDIIKQFRQKHGNKYDYSKVNFVNNKTDVIIGCPTHGDFPLDPGHHLMGVGCRKCAGRGLTNDDWIQRAKDVHGNKYDYSKFNFEKAITKTIVICPKHGEWSTTPNDHINSGTGCPTCKESKGEKYITELLNQLNIGFERQKKYNDCKGSEKKYCKKLPFDFYLYDYNTLIEYDGRQHFEPVYGEEQLKIQQTIDKIKDDYCKNNNINLIRVSFKLPKDKIEFFILSKLK
jgi:hypothetical protein